MNYKTKELIEVLRQFSTTELCDGIENLRVLDYRIQRIVTERKIVGIAFPVEVPEGVCGIVPEAVRQAEPEHVLVITGHGRCDCAYWGDKSGYSASVKQLEGVVVDGAIRDLDGCADQGVPVFARGVTPRSALHEYSGRLNVPVLLDGVKVRPDDIIVGDSNGVVVLSVYEAEEFLDRPTTHNEYTIQAIMEDYRPSRANRFQGGLFHAHREDE